MTIHKHQCVRQQEPREEDGPRGPVVHQQGARVNSEEEEEEEEKEEEEEAMDS